MLQAFTNYGPAISTRGPGQGFSRAIGADGTFAGLTGWAVDANGQPQSFLSTEENFDVVKALHEKNLILPVSGDFGGPKAIRPIGGYLKKVGGTVSAFIEATASFVDKDVRTVRAVVAELGGELGALDPALHATYHAARTVT